MTLVRERCMRVVSDAIRDSVRERRAAEDAPDGESDTPPASTSATPRPAPSVDMRARRTLPSALLDSARGARSPKDKITSCGE
jgi:hypothetical protein